MEDVYLTNYQRCTGEEVLAEKLMREKRSKGPTLHTRRTDLPKYFNAYIVFIRLLELCLSRPYPFKFFKGCLPHNLLSPFLNTLPQI